MSELGFLAAAAEGVGRFILRLWALQLFLVFEANFPKILFQTERASCCISGPTSSSDSAPASPSSSNDSGRILREHVKVPVRRGKIFSIQGVEEGLGDGSRLAVTSRVLMQRGGNGGASRRRFPLVAFDGGVSTLRKKVAAGCSWQ
jgi:hypothetical protein